jgi:apolipoprotein D and lipocalin family protein
MAPMLRLPRMRHARWAAALAACLATLSELHGAPVEPAAGIDLARFLGRWYVVAQAPAADPRMVGGYFEYLPDEDGQIRDTYSARPAFDRPPVVLSRNARPDPAQPSRWTVSSGWFSSSERWILYVSPDYRLALAGDPDRSAGWILSREPEIAEWSYAGLVARLALQGYDVSRFRRVVQKPEQLGRPGFE